MSPSVGNTDAMDVVVRAAADMLGQTIRIHHPDGRIDEVGEGEQLNVLLEDDHYTFLTDVARAERAEREQTDRTGRSRKKLFIDIDPDFKIMWKVSGDLTEDFTARIDAEIEHDGLTMEERSLVRANEFKDFYETNQRKPSQIGNPKTPEEKEEKSLSNWFHDMKNAKKGKRTSKLYKSVEKILIDLLGKNWFENKDLEQQSLLKAIEFKDFYETKGKPTCINKPKTAEENIEASLANWFGNMKNAHEGKGTYTLYPSVEKMLVDLLGENWFENEDLKQTLMKATEYKYFYETNQRKPREIDTPKTSEEKSELSLARWFNNMKNTKKGTTGRPSTLYSSVEKILIDLLGEHWFENKDLEQQSLLKAIEYKDFYETKGNPTCINKPKTAEASLANWFGNMKKAHEGKGTYTLYPSVEKMLVDLLGENWFENEDLKQTLMKAHEFNDFYKTNQRKPINFTKPKTEEEKTERCLGNWFNKMKNAKNGKGKLYPSVEKILVDLLGENWFENTNLEQAALLKANEFKYFYEKKGKPRQLTKPKTEEEKTELSLSRWFGDMKKAKDGKGTHKLYPSVEKILVDLLGENWVDATKEPSKHKPMTRTITPSTSLNPQPPHLSQLSLYHKEYKTLHSSNLAAKFKERPQLWSSYHQVAEANELSFPDGQVPYQRVIAFLQTHLATFHPKKHKTIVDMGCGTARVHRAFADRPNLTFHNLDHVACDDRVTVADISHTELEDGDADVVILCLALWGSNKEEYFKEAFRLLDPNGRLILVEPSKRWMDETGHRLRDTLLRHGFTIVQEDFMTGDQVNKFSLFVVKK